MKKTLFFVMAMLLIAFSLHAANFTETEWVKTTVDDYGIKYNVWTHTIAVTTGDTICYTAVTPSALDTTKEWEVILNAGGATIDGTTLPITLVGGYSDDSTYGFVNGSIAFTDMVELKTIEADVKATIGAVTVNPNLLIADVTDILVNATKLPYYGIYYKGTTAFSGSVSVITIIIQVAPR